MTEMVMDTLKVYTTMNEINQNNINSLKEV